MFIRLPLLLFCMLGLAFGQARLPAVCAFAEEASCATCCADMEMVCCTGGESVPGEIPDSTAPPTASFKLWIIPTPVLLGPAPLPALEQNAEFQRQAARLPAWPRLDLTCIRLI